MKAQVPAILFVLYAISAAPVPGRAQTPPRQQPSEPPPANPSQQQTVNPPQQQTPLAPGTAPAATKNPAQPMEGDGDRWGSLRELADQTRTAYEEIDKANEAEVETLMRSKRCQVNRVGGLLDRNLAALKQWQTQERKYWDVWQEAESKRVEAQQKALLSFEEQQESVSNMMELEKKNRQQLEREKLKLEQSKRTEDIALQIDGLIKDIQQSEETLTHAQQEYDELTVQVNNMKASISARLVNIRQTIVKVDAYVEDITAFYEKQRAAANEVCNAKQPDARKTSLPKRTGKDQQ